MAKIKIRPLDDRIVVQAMEAEETTAGGIVLPGSAQEKPQRGTILAVGPGKLLDSGQRGDLSVRKSRFCVNQTSSQKSFNLPSLHYTHLRTDQKGLA